MIQSKGQGKTKAILELLKRYQGIYLTLDSMDLLYLPMFGEMINELKNTNRQNRNEIASKVIFCLLQLRQEYFIDNEYSTIEILKKYKNNELNNSLRHYWAMYAVGPEHNTPELVKNFVSFQIKNDFEPNNLIDEMNNINLNSNKPLNTNLELKSNLKKVTSITQIKTSTIKHKHKKQQNKTLVTPITTETTKTMPTNCYRINSKHKDYNHEINLPFILAIDEADNLCSKVIDDDDDVFNPIRCLQRVMNSRDDFTVIMILLSTISKLKILFPQHQGSRHALRHDPKPFYDFIFHDLIDSYVKYNHPFFYGRILWYQYFMSLKTNNLSILFKYATELLINRKDINETNSKTDMLLSCVLFSVRYSLCPTIDYAETFMANHMGTVIHIDIANESNEPNELINENENKNKKKDVSLIVKYLSEPILAEVSACLMNHHINFMADNVIKIVQSSLSHTKILQASKGDCGELAACVAIQMIKDNIIRINHIQKSYNKRHDPNDLQLTYCASISVIELLRALKPNIDIDSETKQTNNLLDPFEGYEVNFNHFIRIDTLNDQIISYLYNRNAAVIAKENCEHIDVLIIARKITNGIISYAPIIIQVKNYSRKINESQALGWLIPLVSAIFSVNIFENNPIISMLCSVGHGGIVEINKMREPMILRSNIQYPEQLLLTLDLQKESNDFPSISSDTKLNLCNFHTKVNYKDTENNRLYNGALGNLMESK